MDEINKITDKIIEALDSKEWTVADRLTDVLKELVKIEIAAIQGRLTQSSEKDLTHE